MKSKTIILREWDECSEELKNKILDNYWDININYDWWDNTYDDAENIGLKITGFDIDRGNYCEGKFIASAEATAHKIKKEHGETCETYKTAADYLQQRDAIMCEQPKDENGEIDEYELDAKLDELDAEFLRSLLEEYRIILRNEYEYLTSKEAIIETLKANEYLFNEQGKIDTV